MRWMPRWCHRPLTRAMTPKRLETSHQSVDSFNLAVLTCFVGNAFPCLWTGVVSAPRPPPFGTKVPDRCGGPTSSQKGGGGRDVIQEVRGFPRQKKYPKTKPPHTESHCQFLHPTSNIIRVHPFPWALYMQMCLERGRPSRSNTSPCGSAREGGSPLPWPSKTHGSHSLAAHPLPHPRQGTGASGV